MRHGINKRITPLYSNSNEKEEMLQQDVSIFKAHWLMCVERYKIHKRVLFPVYTNTEKGVDLFYGFLFRYTYPPVCTVYCKFKVYQHGRSHCMTFKWQYVPNMSRQPPLFILCNWQDKIKSNKSLFLILILNFVSNSFFAAFFSILRRSILWIV